MNSQNTLIDAEDRRFMKVALALARRGLGIVAPNPSVGCILISEKQKIVGRGWTQKGGRPHAETEALVRAQSLANGATAYVTLEPCNHIGETGSCADALIDAGVRRVVIAIEDPDKRVRGQGIARLREAGLNVVTGVCAEKAAELNEGFFLHRREGRPLVTLKSATTLDGRIATKNGESRWITGLSARHRGHLMRKTHDAVLIGIGTALVDDPELTCRLPGLEEYSPIRVVIDTQLRLPVTSRLVQTAWDTPTWLVVSSETNTDIHAAYERLGVRVIPVEVGTNKYPNPLSILHALARCGLTRVLVEGGSRISAALMKAGLIDRLVWFRASSIIGGDGFPVIAPCGFGELDLIPKFEFLSVELVGEDRLETYRITN